MLSLVYILKTRQLIVSGSVSSLVTGLQIEKYFKLFECQVLTLFSTFQNVYNFGFLVLSLNRRSRTNFCCGKNVFFSTFCFCFSHKFDLSFSFQVFVCFCFQMDPNYGVMNTSLISSQLRNFRESQIYFFFHSIQCCMDYIFKLKLQNNP